MTIKLSWWVAETSSQTREGQSGGRREVRKGPHLNRRGRGPAAPAAVEDVPRGRHDCCASAGLTSLQAPSIQLHKGKVVVLDDVGFYTPLTSQASVKRLCGLIF